tara:strand:- start:2697 stop:3626 length:930 start_codon:yes stop_codon:yes gene_type:complete
MAPRKRTKGTKPKETMRQRQMRLRKMERALKSAKKQLPPGKKGGAMVKAGSSKPMSPRAKAALDRQKRAAQGSKGGTTRMGGRGLPKQTLRLPPGGKTAANLMKNAKVAGGPGQAIAAIGLALQGVATAQDIAASLKRGEGYARLPKMVAKALTAKAPARTKGATNRRGRTTKPVTGSSKSTTKPKAKRKTGMSNIPPAEGPVNNPNYGKKATTKKPATQAKPQAKQSQKKKETPKTSTYTRVTESKATDRTVDPGMPSNPQLKSQKKTLTARQQMLQRKKEKARQVLNSRTASPREKMQARITLRGKK